MLHLFKLPTADSGGIRFLQRAHDAVTASMGLLSFASLAAAPDGILREGISLAYHQQLKVK